jgi:hypothetical protein
VEVELSVDAQVKAQAKAPAISLSPLSLFLLASATAGVLLYPAEKLTLETSSALVLASTALVIGVLLRRPPGGFWSVTTLFVSVLAVFHVGLAFFPLLNMDLDPGSGYQTWFYSTLVPRAMWMVALATLAYGLGVCLVPPRRRARSGSGEQGAASRDSAAALMGTIVVTVAVLGWLAMVIPSLGFKFILASYEEYLFAVTGPVGYVFYGLGLGLVMVAAGDDPRYTKIALMVFAGFALLALPIGLRGEVLFPLAAYAGIYARRHRMPGATLVILSAFALLAAIGAIKELRQVGLDDIGQVTASASPVAALGELGGTIRVVTVSMDWHEIRNEPYAHGVTYWAPVDRIVSKAMGTPVPAAPVDWRLMNVEISDREGPIGGSLIAEAHHNFGTAGVVGVPLLIGFVMALLERRPVRPHSDILLGLLSVSLLQHVRNAFTSVPFELLLGIALILFLLVLRKGEDGAVGELQRHRARAGGPNVPAGPGVRGTV